MDEAYDMQRRWMTRAVELGKRSVTEPGRESAAPKVGVVIARGSELIGESYRGATGKGQHAEYGLIDRLEGVDLKESELYTTLEPCSRRSEGKIPCAERIRTSGISTVFIGMYDPNPRIYREGWRMLRDAGIRLRDFSADLRAEIKRDNSIFVESFQISVGDEGMASFDYMQNDGRYTIDSSSAGTFETRWTPKGSDSIYAVDSQFHVAKARYATEFAEIDDPGALDFSSHSVGVAEGEIAVFRNNSGYVLVRIQKVFAGPRRGSDHYELQIQYQAKKRSFHDEV